MLRTKDIYISEIVSYLTTVRIRKPLSKKSSYIYTLTLLLTRKPTNLVSFEHPASCIVIYLLVEHGAVRAQERVLSSVSLADVEYLTDYGAMFSLIYQVLSKVIVLLLP